MIGWNSFLKGSVPVLKKDTNSKCYFAEVLVNNNLCLYLLNLEIINYGEKKVNPATPAHNLACTNIKNFQKIKYLKQHI